MRSSRSIWKHGKIICGEHTRMLKLTWEHPYSLPIVCSFPLLLLAYSEYFSNDHRGKDIYSPAWERWARGFMMSLVMYSCPCVCWCMCVCRCSYMCVCVCEVRGQSRMSFLRHWGTFQKCIFVCMCVLWYMCAWECFCVKMLEWGYVYVLWGFWRSQDKCGFSNSQSTLAFVSGLLLRIVYIRPMSL